MASVTCAISEFTVESTHCFICQSSEINSLQDPSAKKGTYFHCFSMNKQYEQKNLVKFSYDETTENNKITSINLEHVVMNLLKKSNYCLQVLDG